MYTESQTNAVASHLAMMNCSDLDLSKAISLFKQKMILYLEEDEISDEAKQARKICHGTRDAELKWLNASGLNEADKKVKYPASYGMSLETKCEFQNSEAPFDAIQTETRRDH